MRFFIGSALAVMAAAAATPASTAQNVQPACTIQAVVLEQYTTPAGNNYARLMGLGNCGLGIEPTYSWSNIAIRDQSKPRDLRLGPTYQVEFRLRRPNALIKGVFGISYGSSAATCAFALSRSNYEQICP